MLRSMELEYSQVEELLTASDCARLADVVPETVRLWYRTGKLPAAFRTPTGIRLYRRTDIERFLAGRGHSDVAL